MKGGWPTAGSPALKTTPQTEQVKETPCSLLTRLTIGSAITILFGGWHVFVPAIWNWYCYFPSEAHELVVAVRAINAFFSMSLVIFGAVMLVFIHRKPMVIFYARSMSISLYPAGHAGRIADDLAAGQYHPRPAIWNAGCFHPGIRTICVFLVLHS